MGFTPGKIARCQILKKTSFKGVFFYEAILSTKICNGSMRRAFVSRALTLYAVTSTTMALASSLIDEAPIIQSALFCTLALLAIISCRFHSVIAPP